MGEEETTALMYCNLISPQFLGDSTPRCIRTFVFPSSSFQHEFQNVFYVPVEQRTFQNIRINFLMTEGLHIPFEASTTPTKVVLHFRKISSGKVHKIGRRHLEQNICSDGSIRSVPPKSGRTWTYHPGDPSRLLRPALPSVRAQER